MASAFGAMASTVLIAAVTMGRVAFGTSSSWTINPAYPDGHERARSHPSGWAELQPPGAGPRAGRHAVREGLDRERWLRGPVVSVRRALYNPICAGGDPLRRQLRDPVLSVVGQGCRAGGRVWRRLDLQPSRRQVLQRTRATHRGRGLHRGAVSRGRHGSIRTAL